MNVRCPTCETVYRVDPAKVPKDGVRARCAECAGVIPVPPPGADGRPAAAATPMAVPRAVAPPASPKAPPAPAHTATKPAGTPKPRMTRPISGAPGPVAAPPPKPAPHQPTRPVIVRPDAEELTRAKAPVPERPSAPVFRPTEGPPMAAPPVPPKAPPSPPQVRAAPEPRVAISDEVTARQPAIPTVPEPPAIESPPAPRPASTGPAAGVEKAKPREAPALGEAPAPPQPRGPINPFLSRDPRQKARRLARALVSDMIVYQPEKRQQALAAGTLKDAFAEEIKKSWEEYVDQVGKEIADSTSYFTDALNEILAGGEQVF